MAESPESLLKPREPWYRGVTWYHWVVVLVASSGWLFDCMDQRIFVLSREPAMQELLVAEDPALAELSEEAFDAEVKDWLGWATFWMLIGWATGGIIFGIMSDRLGRVKTMVVTLLIYSGFTGLSGMARTGTEFVIYRFLVGLGVGGMFGAATTLVAESVPAGFRALALGSLQALSAGGNILGSLISLGIPPGQEDLLWGFTGWRVIFFVGILPAILVIPIVLILREPERWKEAKLAAAEEKRVPIRTILFSFRGRMPRETFWLVVLPLHAVAGGIVAISLTLEPSSRLPFALVVSPFFLWISLAVQTKRWHDRNKSPWWLLLQLIPIIGPVWTIVELGFYPGTSGSNRYAEDPIVHKALGSIGQIFVHPVWRRNLLVGVALGLAGMAGLWGIGFFTPELVSAALKGEPQAVVDRVRGFATAGQDVGAFFGMMTFTFVAAFVGRKPAFFGAFLLCLGVTIFVFNSLNSAMDAYWMLPMVGFATLSVFGPAGHRRGVLLQHGAVPGRRLPADADVYQLDADRAWGRRAVPQGGDHPLVHLRTGPVCPDLGPRNQGPAAAGIGRVGRNAIPSNNNNPGSHAPHGNPMPGRSASGRIVRPFRVGPRRGASPQCVPMQSMGTRETNPATHGARPWPKNNPKASP